MTSVLVLSFHGFIKTFNFYAVKFYQQSYIGCYPFVPLRNTNFIPRIISINWMSWGGTHEIIFLDWEIPIKSYVINSLCVSGIWLESESMPALDKVDWPQITFQLKEKNIHPHLLLQWHALSFSNTILMKRKTLLLDTTQLNNSYKS